MICMEPLSTFGQARVCGLLLIMGRARALSSELKVKIDMWLFIRRSDASDTPKL